MQQWAIGLDIGGTKIEAALVSSNGEMGARLRTPTQDGLGYETVINQIVSSVATLCNNNKHLVPTCMGIGVAGQVNKKTGSVIYAPNLEWHHVPLQNDLSQKLGMPVIICNDVRAATWGEWLFGAGKDCDDMVCIFVGTGIGSGVVSAGKILEGSNNTAGEIGHITIDMHGPVCHCGNTGCLEALAGGWAIGRDAQAEAAKDNNAAKLLLELAQNDIKAITGKTVAEAAAKGDVVAKKIIENVGAALVAGCVSVINAFGPRRLVLGGGVMEGMPQLLPVIRKGVQKNALKAAINLLEILPAKLRNDSGVIGAAALALHTTNNGLTTSTKGQPFVNDII